MDPTESNETVHAHRSIEAQGDFPQGPFHVLSENVSDMGNQLGEYLSRERVRVQASAQKFLLILVAIPILLLLLATLFLIAWVLVFYGATEALAQALGGKTWLAALILGGSLIALVLLAGLIFWFKTGLRVKKAQRRAKKARAELVQSFHETEGSVKKLGSVTAWTERYPLPVTGVAFLAGFSLAGPLTGSSDSEPAKSSDKSKAPPSPVFNRMQVWATLINTGAEILKDVLTPLLQEMVLAKAPPKEETQN